MVAEIELDIGTFKVLVNQGGKLVVISFLDSSKILKENGVDTLPTNVEVNVNVEIGEVAALGSKDQPLLDVISLSSGYV
jgi:hypothetical protein